MLNFLGMLKGGAGAMGGAGAAQGSGQTGRFFQALGSQKMGGGGGTPWNRGIGMQYANTAMQAPNMTVQPVNMRLGQQQRQPIVNPILQMLMQGGM